MYTKGQIEGILILTARPTFKIVNTTSNAYGWIPRYNIAIRVTEKFIEPIRQSLSYLDIENRREREKSRHVDTIFITKQESIDKLLDLIQFDAVNKSNDWSMFEKLMELIYEKRHSEADGRYEFEVILNEKQNNKT